MKAGRIQLLTCEQSAFLGTKVPLRARQDTHQK